MEPSNNERNKSKATQGAGRRKGTMESAPERKRARLSRAPPSSQDIASAVLHTFRQLPKKGKPQPNEYTTLAGVVLRDANRDVGLKTVALGTGTKCLSASKRCESGDVVNDSHAEVIARRAFVSWLIAELGIAVGKLPENVTAKTEKKLLAAGEFFAFDPQTKKFQLLEGVEFHFFVSQHPCGDCAILTPPEEIQSHSLPLNEQVKDGDGTLSTAGKEAEQSVRTGAKPVQNSTQSMGSKTLEEILSNIPRASDVETGPQELGVLRRKPGRGEATLSMSCSDKLARWVLMGIQGGPLLRVLASPIYLESMTVVLGENTSDIHALNALSRGMIDRCKLLTERLNPPFRVAEPKVNVVPSSLLDGFPLTATAQRQVPSGTAINWSAETPPPSPHAAKTWHEVTLGATGRKFGATKKAKTPLSPNTRSRLCRAILSGRVVGLVRALQGGAEEGAELGSNCDWTWREVKEKWGAPYAEQMADVARKPSLFENWIAKEQA
ncbi:hypothetical protein BSKO_09363 [Bryopsis sp. KO-2023]|nr:hypothetical protein BSKO_09363 [Bryopsis sp. KO-2023]